MLRAVLIDLSGTLHIEDKAIPGAIDALNKLRKTNLDIKFVTNTTKESRNFLYNRLTKLGFNLKPEEIHSSLGAAKSLIINRNLKPMLLLSPEAMEDFVGLECPATDKPNAVVVGLAPTEFHYEKLNQAFRCILDGAPLIGIHAAKYYKREDGLALGPGCFVKGLEYSTQSKAELVGKPNPTFFESALGAIPPEQAVMIGDDVQDDIQGAMKIGITGCLVKTGKYRTGDEDKISPKPSYVFPSFVEAVDEILRQYQ
ncbi:hypothetical protein RN001_015168 [Aquatica leii]|uniref:Haloacid dehalogenase-like hydrolase domain-containing protein 2 n=1 Tax=Aquatica leii TaxID=1421715 RepID=A0AAN7PPB1_9COLE|nr:hypothetical protein RN001_015168 [Aquatica leii]